jgi:hypothetical protein
MGEDVLATTLMRINGHQHKNAGSCHRRPQAGSNPTPLIRTPLVSIIFGFELRRGMLT